MLPASLFTAVQFSFAFRLRVIAQAAIVVHMNTTADLIGTAEVARMFGKSHRTIHRMVEAGQLVPAVTAPGGYRGAFLFNRADVARALAVKEAS